MTYYGKLASIVDGAALFILFGMIFYTTLYRRRGKPEDKVYFALILTDIVMAVSDAAVYILQGTGLEDIESVYYTFCFTLFFVALDVFCALWCLYLALRTGWEEKAVKRFMPLFWLPAVIAGIIAVMNGSLAGLSVVITIGGLEATLYQLLTFIPIFIYAIFTLIIAYRRRTRVFALFIPVFAAHVFLNVTIVSNITPLVFAVYLIYAHLFAMRDSFYGEVA